MTTFKITKIDNNEHKGRATRVRLNALVIGGFMGWNEAYTCLENGVIKVYDRGTLDGPTLRALMEPYRNSDIDHGGMQGLLTNDGLSCDEVIVKILRPAAWAAAKELVGEDRDEAIADAWYELTRKEFGYW